MSLVRLPLGKLSVRCGYQAFRVGRTNASVCVGHRTRYRYRDDRGRRPAVHQSTPEQAPCHPIDWWCSRHTPYRSSDAGLPFRFSLAGDGGEIESLTDLRRGTYRSKSDLAHSSFDNEASLSITFTTPINREESFGNVVICFFFFFLHMTSYGLLCTLPSQRCTAWPEI